MLAEAAGVSEALLYRHFESKEALYDAIARQHLEEGEAHPGFDRILAMPPGAPRLIASVQFLISHVYDAGPSTAFPRLMTQSLLEDGALARAVLAKFRVEFLPFFKESIKAAAKAGDLVKDAGPGEAELWLLQHLTFAIRIHRLPDTPTLETTRGERDFLDRAVRFALRGIGLRRRAIEEHYNPELWDEWRERAE